MTDELIVNDYSIELTDSFPIPVSFSIADIKNPQQRKQSISKQGKIPGTMNNCAFFKGAFTFHTTENGVSFDPTAKAECILKKRGVQVMKGVMQLESVTDDNDFLTFNVRVMSDNVDLFQLLSTIFVSELDWSAYDHTLNRTNIKNSWTATPGTGYYYPLIERGLGRPGSLIWRTVDFMPYVYVREVLSKMFEWAGVEWDSTFLDTDLFKSVLWGYGGGDVKTITPAQILQRKVELDNGDFNDVYTVESYSSNRDNTAIARLLSYSLATNTNPFGELFTSTETSDLLNQFDLGEITVQNTGNYNLTIACALDYSVNVGVNTFNQLINPRITVFKNGSLQYFITDATTIFTTSTGTITFDTNINRNLYLQSGDVISFGISYGTAQATASVGQEAEPLEITITTNGATTLDFTSIDTTITDGSTVTLAQMLPEMKCSDFLLGAIRQFNLYQSDPDIDSVTKIEPLTDFYSATNVFTDISTLVDYNKPIEMRPSANEYAKNIIYSFKPSTDFDATTYADKWSENYGDFKYIQSSYYAKGELKTELPWSTIVPYEIAPGILIPRFVKIENNVIKPNTGASRIMIRNGQKNGSIVLQDTVGGGSETVTQYPCVHHFNNWENPTFDLNFKLVSEVYYTATIVTTSNCYSEYYSTFINEMTSKAGQIVNLSVKWNETDIKNRDFGKLIMVNGALFRLNEIKEFSADKQDSVEIELVKVLAAKKRRGIQITLQAPTRPTNPTIQSTPGVGSNTGVIVGGLPGKDINIIRG